jgi:hypothetical protein
MSKLVNSVYQIHNNPFILAPLIVEFFKHTKPQPNNILLAYLVLPLVLQQDSRESLKGVRIDSTIHSIGKKKKEIFFGLPERVKAYKELTNKSLQYAIDNKLIKINEELAVDVLIKKNTVTNSLKDALKASSNLHKIFKDLDVVAIYRLLGIKEL